VIRLRGFATGLRHRHGCSPGSSISSRTLTAPTADVVHPGRYDKFDRSISDFWDRYANQNEKDYQTCSEAIRSGPLDAVEGV